MTAEHTLFSRKTERIAWAALIPLLCLLFCSHIYNDILITARQGIMLWDILFQGRFFDFFSEEFRTASGNLYYTVEQTSAYNILLYLIFAIWNIPLALLMKFTSLDVMNSLPCLLWIKAMLPVFLLLSAWAMTAVLKELKLSRQRIRLAWFLLLSSGVLIYSLFITSQYDIIGIPFQLLGILYFLRNDKKRFVAYFSIAVCFKAFALILFLPLLLLKEKRPFRILGMLLLVMLPNFLTTAVFSLFGTTGDGGIMSIMLSMLFTQDVAGINFFILIYGGLVVWSYVHPAAERVEPRQVLWLCFTAITSFFGFCATYPYWKILMAPYWVMLIAAAPEGSLNVSLLLEGVGQAALVVYQMVIYYWCFWGNTMKSMLFGILMPERTLRGDNPLEYLFSLQIGAVISISRSLFLAAFLVLAYIHFPGKQKRQQEEALFSDILFFRSAMVLGVCMLPILSLFI